MDMRKPENEPTWVEHQGRLMTGNTEYWLKHLPSDTLFCKHKVVLSEHCKECHRELDDGA